MGGKTSTIRLTTGAEISVAMGLDDLVQQIARLRDAPFMKITDPEGGSHLVRVDQIVAIDGPD